ncbi:chaperonin 10-like protein [Aspergillus pseudoustus]|uniref:Chaperonin 10-like protein n=1 Tax=Aspergillus pseudoustus TaxID=1810923 RepID=A0ABR4JA64_9EURO
MKGIIAEYEEAALQVTDSLELPEPSTNQILVKSIYTAINPVDHMMVNMGILVESWPFVPGCDAAGIVVKVGGEQAASKFSVGDEVCGCTRLGMKGYSTCQEFFLMDADLTIPKPKNLSLAEAATIGVGVETAALGIFKGCAIPLPDPDNLPAPKNEWAVVLGGASTVGRFGIQLFKLLGYKVIASCGTRSFETVKQTGADVVFDYKIPTTEQISETLSVLNETRGNLHYVLDAAAGGFEFGRALFKELPDGVAKYFATTNDWSGITDFEGGKSDCIKLGLIGRDSGTEVNDALVAYIPVLARLFQLGQLVPAPYVEIGNGGFDAVLEALQYQKTGAAGSKKVVVQVQDR